MSGLIGKKLGMTSVYTPTGENVACTVIELGPCFVTQIKTGEIDGYESIQLAYGDKREKTVSAPLKGHYKKAGVSPKSTLVEFESDFASEFQLGAELKLSDVFAEGDVVDVIGKSKGKGFQGVVKRYNFRGVGQATHGQHNRLRAPGSIGACSTPSRVFKGMRMAGRMGNDRKTVQGLRILKVIEDKNLVVVSGSVPGAKNSIVILEK